MKNSYFFLREERLKSVKVIILDNLFTGEWKAKGREEMIEILDRPMNRLLEDALTAADMKAENLEDFHISDSDELMVLSLGACAVSAKVLASFASSSASRLVDRDGLAGGLKVQTAILASLIEQKESIFFEDLLQDQESRPVKGAPDQEKENFMVMDAPLVHSFESLQRAEQQKFKEIARKWMNKGVRIDQPDLVRIGPGVKIGEGTWISGICYLVGQTVIGKNCRITDRSEIIDSILGDQVTVKSSLIESSEMDEGSNIGPFSHLRPGAKIGRGCHIGNFVEVKNSVLGPGTKAGHLAYIGDADLGEEINVSCGVIFCNYDGKRKHRSAVGSHSFLGSNANLVAPVVIDENTFIAAGSTITKDVQEGCLAVERAEQRNLPGYVERKKNKGEL